MPDTAGFQVNIKSTAMSPDDMSADHRAAAHKFAATFDADLRIQNSARASSQVIAPQTAARMASEAQQQFALLEAFLPPRLENRQQRLRWKALRHLHPDTTLVLNKWQGQILECRDRVFTARLFDLVQSDTLEIATFDVSEVGPDDRPFIRPGAIFYWYIMQRDHAGRRTPLSLMWFRRGGRMTEEKFQAERRQLDAIWENFGWTVENQPSQNAKPPSSPEGG